jgi:hypothetical protein
VADCDTTISSVSHIKGAVEKIDIMSNLFIHNRLDNIFFGSSSLMIEFTNFSMEKWRM